MSANDVLAVMDAIEGWAREVSDEFIDGSGFREEYRRDLSSAREARAAVAELVEAARKVQEKVAPLLESNGYGFVGPMESLRTALARFGVAK